ncbi:MAG TPA: cytochrome c, partial [Acidobacteriaceae bacterium]
MKRARFALAVAVSALVCAGISGYAQVQVELGARQFAVTCAGCHGADGSGSLKGPAIGSLAKTVARSDDELIRIVRDGVPGKGMPPAKALGDEKVAALVRYLRVLQLRA